MKRPHSTFQNDFIPFVISNKENTNLCKCGPQWKCADTESSVQHAEFLNFVPDIKHTYGFSSGYNHGPHQRAIKKKKKKIKRNLAILIRTVIPNGL